MSDIKIFLGKRIRHYRELRKMTQEQLAEKINVNFRTISLIERGSNFVTAETLEKLSLALDVPPKKLFDFDNENIADVKNIKEELIKLIDKNDDKIYSIYKIVKGFVD